MIQWGAGGVMSRTRHMGENLVRLMERAGDGSKAIYWAHNFHVGIETFPDRDHTGGHVLRQRFGEAYYALALEFGVGACQTRDILPESVLGTFRQAAFDPPKDGSLPWHLSRAGLDDAIINLRTPPGAPAIQQWLQTPLPVHAINWVYNDPEAQWEPRAPGLAYDGIAFISTSTPSHPTPTAQATAARGDAL
jgi:erythromycin esterase